MTEKLQLLSDRIEIHELVARYVTYIDTKQWRALLDKCLAERVFADYSALRPDAPGQEITAEELVNEWSSRMSDVSALHHHFSNVFVDLDGDSASGGAAGISTHKKIDDQGKTYFWQIGAHYDLGFERTVGGWRISRTVIKPAYIHEVAEAI